MNGQVINEQAFLMAREILWTVQGCLRPEEHRDAFEEFFAICKRELERYETHMDRTQQRLKPSRN